MTTYRAPRTVTRPAGSTVPQTENWKRYRDRTFYAFVSPWLAGFILLTLFPLGYALWLSFTNYDGLTGRYRYVGGSNYTDIFRDLDAMHALARTGLYTVITVPAGIILGLALAVLVNRPIRGRPLFRALLYLPAVVPIVGSALCFKLLFNSDFGMLNKVLGWFGISSIDWLADPTVFWVMIAMTLWGVGGTMIISLSGLQGIPPELQEAARVDGANNWQVFQRITLPLLSPIILFETITGVIFAVQAFIPALLLSVQSGSAAVTAVPQSNYLYMIHVYAQYFAYGRFGYASALLWVLFLLILILTVIIFKASASTVFYESGPDEPATRRGRRGR
jgi:multiple sugar transport system permease protein